MDIEIIYTVVGALMFLAIVFFVLRSDVSAQVQSKEKKRYAILNEYKKQLREALEPLQDNNEAYVAKKNELLKQISNELSLNIFFDASEIKDVIMDLAQDT